MNFYDNWLTTHPNDYFVEDDDWQVDNTFEAREIIEKMMYYTYEVGDLQKFEDAFEDLVSLFGLSLPFANPKFKVNSEKDIKFPFIKKKVKNQENFYE